jgi:hypothetical protein
MYVFDDELREGFRRGHSLVVFDHWKRVQRPILADAFARLSEATHSSHSHYGAASASPSSCSLNTRTPARSERAGHGIARRWQPLLTFTSASDLEQSSS